jgi:hypothetical protein
MLTNELGKAFDVSTVRLFCASLPSRDSGLGDPKQCTELGLGVTHPVANRSDVPWLHHRLVRHHPISHKLGYIVAVRDKHL